MRRMTLSISGFDRCAKTKRRAVFPWQMNRVVPRGELCTLIDPFYPKRGNGRAPIGLERMLRIYFLQQWFNFSDSGVEEALYDSAEMRSFVGIDLGCEPAPDETAVCKFRCLLEQHEIGRKLFEQAHVHLDKQGIEIATGTVVDTTIVNTPSSTKNKTLSRDSDMHQTLKGKQWYFGMKAHMGAGSRNKVIHAVVATAANVADSVILTDLLHSGETRVWSDRGYQGKAEVIREHAPKALDLTHRHYRFKNQIDELWRARNRTKLKVRAKVEHVLGVIKRIFGFTKVRYRVLDKNTNRLFATCVLTNLFLVRAHLLQRGV